MPTPIDFLKSQFGEKPKNSQDVMAKLLAALHQLDLGGQHEKPVELVARNLSFLKAYLFGDAEHEVSKEVALELANQMMKTDLLYLLVKHLAVLDFEARKDAAQVFGATIRIRDSEDRSPGAQYVLEHPYIITKLVAGYDDPNIALNCGTMLRDCLRDEPLARQLLESPMFLGFFERVEVANFEIASDAFATFKDLLSRHKATVAQYLLDHYNEFFPEYMKLLKSSNYVTRRQSLKLLGELLLDRANVKLMVRFVGEVQHLMQMMMMLKDSSRSIQFEAFHVFKVFVANPSKPQPIIDILANNKEKLLKYLEEFHTDRDESDEMFKEEKAVLIREISMLGGGGGGGASATAPALAAPPPSEQQQQQAPQ